MRRDRGREKNELIPQPARQLAVVCPLLLVQNWDQTPKAKQSRLGPGHPPETKNSLFALYHAIAELRLLHLLVMVESQGDGLRKVKDVAGVEYPYVKEVVLH